MLDRLETRTVTDFRRHRREIVSRLVETGAPILLTRRGKPAVVVQERAAFERLLEERDRLHALMGIRRGLDSVERGEGIPLDEAFEEIIENLRRREEP